MTTDDKINVGILIAALLFAVLAFPAALRQHDDARFGHEVRRMFPQ